MDDTCPDTKIHLHSCIIPPGSSCLSRINITAGDPEVSIYIVVYENILLQMLEYRFFPSEMFDIFGFFVTNKTRLFFPQFNYNATQIPL